MSEILKKLKEDGIKFIELEFTDIFGHLKSIEIPVECAEEAIKKGIWFDGSSIKGFARIKESDMYFDDDKTYVDIETGESQFSKAEIEIGLSDGINIEVISGLTPGQKIKKQ